MRCARLIAILWCAACGGGRESAPTPATPPPAEVRAAETTASATEPVTSPAPPPPPPACIAPEAEQAIACSPGDPAAPIPYAQLAQHLRTYDFRPRDPQGPDRDLARRREIAPEAAPLLTSVHAHRCAATGADRASLAYREARFHQEAAHWDEAVLLLSPLVDDPTTPVDLAGYASDLALDALNVLATHVGRPADDCYARFRQILDAARARLCAPPITQPREEMCDRYGVLDAQLRERGF